MHAFGELAVPQLSECLVTPWQNDPWNLPEVPKVLNFRIPFEGECKMEAQFCQWTRHSNLLESFRFPVGPLVWKDEVFFGQSLHHFQLRE